MSENPVYQRLLRLLQDQSVETVELALGEWHDVLDVLWPEIEKYQKFVEGVISLGPDGIKGQKQAQHA